VLCHDSTFQGSDRRARVSATRYGTEPWPRIAQKGRTIAMGHSAQFVSASGCAPRALQPSRSTMQPNYGRFVRAILPTDTPEGRDTTHDA